MGIFDPYERVQFQDWIRHRGRFRVGTELPQATRYVYLVDQFSSFQMTRQDDALNDFRGILNHFDPLFSPSFARGLPESFFDHGLLWWAAGCGFDINFSWI